MDVKWYKGLFPNFTNTLIQGVGSVAYRIVYHDETEGCCSKKGRNRFFLTACFFLLFLLLVSVFYPQGREILRILLIPGDPDVTLHAAEVFAQELGNGYSMADAAKNFCITVLNHGYPG